MPDKENMSKSALGSLTNSLNKVADEIKTVCQLCYIELERVVENTSSKLTHLREHQEQGARQEQFVSPWHFRKFSYT